MGVALMVLLSAGCILAAIGGVLFLVAAFRHSVGWGLAVLLLPFAALVFLVTYWKESARPFFIQLAGTLLMLVSVGLGVAVKVPALAALPGFGPALGNETVEWRAEATEPIMSPAKDAEQLPPPLDPTARKNPRLLIGRTLDEVEHALGRPKGRMTGRSRTGLLYEGFSVFSDDGRTISDVQIEGGR